MLPTTRTYYRHYGRKVCRALPQGGKNDNNDAEAICEAVNRRNIWFVPLKTADQQAVLTLHRVRRGLIEERTAMINQVRGLLAEFGIVVGKGRYTLQKHLPDILEDAQNNLPSLARQMVSKVWQRIKLANEEILEYDRLMSQLVREDDNAKRLMTIPGVGEQVATGVIASTPDPRLFKNSRQFSAWLGLVPRQFTTGGHIRLGRITKRGDTYLRTCLIHGARAVIANLKDKDDLISQWVRELIQRRGYLRAVVALAARNARLIWTLMIKKENYKAMYIQAA